MYKAKLCGFAIACVIGLAGLAPITAFAAEVDTESVTLSEKNNDKKDKKTAYSDAIREAKEKWNTLTIQQKNEIYKLLEDEMKAQIALMDKLVEFGIMKKDDADKFKIHMARKLEEVKASGEFPLIRQREKKQ